MTDDAHLGSHPNVIPLRPEQSGNMRVALTHDRVLRIKMRMTELKMDQTELAHATGLSASGISQIFKGKIKGTRHFPLFAKALKVNVDWLLGDTDQRVDLSQWQGEDISEKDLSQLLERFDLAAESVATVSTGGVIATEFDRRGQTVAVPEIDLMQASGHLVGGIHVLAHNYIIGRALIEMHTRADPANVMVAQGIGDAMEPVLNTTDLLFIDTSRRVVQTQDVIWLVRYAGMLAIRRVRMTPQGVCLMAANPLLPEQVVDAEHLEVLGRVVGALRKF
ncbi:XRE family transcriptional regulator [Novosphingobium sp. KACC 22771]|uniref:XRE family transcriptional regulator n=1 Tax=Novosphingobium sp. KACC 22771 TaxID=3025670 RepID=UPI0023657E7A|nr:LexA family transcriptional regulator [Novosphingobium sp. KACC 22771]WDF71497.1 LexA family transcriptional regulator [Novosphingobium sp. KACC 22771]